MVRLFNKLEKNLAWINRIFANCYDLKVRKAGKQNGRSENMLIVFFDTLVEKELLNDNVIKPLVNWQGHREEKFIFNSVEKVRDRFIEAGNIKKVYTFEKLSSELTSGNVIVLFSNSDVALSVNLPGWKQRNVDEPGSEVVVRGPKEGFVEVLDTNIGLLRRRFRTGDLKAELLNIGNVSKTVMALVYLQGAVNKKVLNEVKKRLKKIDLDVILDTSNIEQLIEDSSFSPFPQMVSTERPDSAAIALSQGRVAIVMEGTPHVLLIPGLFTDFLHSVEDFYHRFYFSLAVRLLRYLMFTIALLLPGLYIAVTTYHQEMLPTPLLITITSARTGVPFPALVEALLMEIVFEALREAGIRLPKAVGQAVTIVGALIIGEAAVTAGIVSQTMVIVVALTGIASFTIPGYSAAISARLLRFPVMFLAAATGIYGILISLLIIVIHLAGLKSFGVPYISPLASLSGEELASVLRVPLPFQNVFKRKGSRLQPFKKGSKEHEKN